MEVILKFNHISSFRSSRLSVEGIERLGLKCLSLLLNLHLVVDVDAFLDVLLELENCLVMLKIYIMYYCVPKCFKLQPVFWELGQICLSL